MLTVEGISPEVVNMRFVKPLDTDMLDRIAKRFTHVMTIEDNVVIGGMGSAVAEYFAAKDATSVKLRLHGIPDRFIDHGSPAELYKEIGLDPPGIVAVAKEFLAPSRSNTHRPASVFVS